MLTYPFVFSLILFLFWILYKITKKKSFRFVLERFMITSSIILFYFISPIMNDLSDFLNCTELNGNFYITNHLIEKCNDNTRYNFWKLTIVIPSFLFFGFLIPFFAFYYMFKRRKNLYNDSVIYKIGFFLNGYTAENFYWYSFFLGLIN